MKRLVSFFGDKSPVFEELNNRAKEYALEKNIEFVWDPQLPFDWDDVVENLNNSDAALIDIQPYNESVFSRMNDRCKILIRFGVGYDAVDLDAATRHGICVARTAGANKTGVAEMALTQILAVNRQLGENRKVIESGHWVKNQGHELLGKRVGILGFGNIGRQLAKLLKGFSCEILVYDNHRDEEAAGRAGVRYAGLDEIFSTCDAISVHLPYNENTHHIIGEHYLRMMKKDAVIVCTARGNIVDEDALYEVLAEHRIGGAGLDVYATEPLPADSKLIGLDNLVLTPHVSSQTVESNWNIYKRGIEIAADFFEGKELGRADLLNPSYAEYPRA
ncbi:MAG: phosphoglycerate dehydrogenase [Oscillospiraceae bacterium]